MARVAQGGDHCRTTQDWPAVGRDPFEAQVSASVEECRTRLSDELAVIAALVRRGAVASAAIAIEDQREAVRALANDLDRAVAKAVGNRVRVLPVEPARRPVPQARLRLAGALAAALLGFGIVIPAALHHQPVGALGGLRPGAGVQTEEEQQLAARDAFRDARLRLAEMETDPANADAVTTEARELHDRILALSDTALHDAQLRREIQYLLREQSTALSSYPGDPEAESMLAEVRALSASLGLPIEPEGPEGEPPASEMPLPAAPAAPAPEADSVPEQPESPPASPAPEEDRPRLLDGSGSRRPDGEKLQLGDGELQAPERSSGDRPGVDLGR